MSGFKLRLSSFPIIGKKILRLMVKAEGGEKLSETLREYVLRYYKVEVGKYSYGSCFRPDFNCGGLKVSVGNYCSFADNVHYFGADHPYEHAVMSPYFYNKRFGGLDVWDVPRKNLTVGHDVWIGYGVVITSSCCKIGNGAVVAAGSVVTKDVPGYAIVGGNPARIIKYRFENNVIQHMEESEWWNMSPNDLMKAYSLIKNPGTWAEHMKGEKR